MLIKASARFSVFLRIIPLQNTWGSAGIREWIDAADGSGSWQSALHFFKKPLDGSTALR